MANPKRNYGMITFYIREEYRETFEDFCKLIEKDENLKALRFKKNYGLLSIAINQMMTAYVEKNKHKLIQNAARPN